MVHNGDSADMPSLSSYDRGKKSFQGRTYRADIDSHLDFQYRLWDTVRNTKRKLPVTYFFEGNHENRIKKAINLQPELEGTISFKDLELSRWYDEVIEYDNSSPGVSDICGISFGHFHISGVMGRPIGGEHPAYSLVSKQFKSIVAGHLHLFDYCVRTDASGSKLFGLVLPCFFDYESDWAGAANKLYSRGVIILDNVDSGWGDLRFISIDSLKKEYA